MQQVETRRSEAVCTLGHRGELSRCEDNLRHQPAARCYIMLSSIEQRGDEKGYGR